MNKLAYFLLLVLATLIWGFGFVATRWTLSDVDPIWSNSLRFLIAGIISFPILFYFKFLKINRSVLICSLLLFVAILIQTIGIAKTTLAKAGFLTTLYAIFTPLIISYFWKTKFKLSYWGSVLLCLIGVAFLCELKFDKVNVGDFYILISAVFFSLHIIAIDKLATDSDPLLFNLAQCFWMGVFSIPIGLMLSGVPNLLFLTDLKSYMMAGPGFGLLFLSIFSSLGAFTIQIIAQKEISPHIVSLIFLSESVFSALFGFIIFNEAMEFIALIGGVFIILGIIWAGLGEQEKNKLNLSPEII